MNATRDLPYGAAPEHRQRMRIGAGIAASIVLHALLLAWSRQPAAPAVPAPAQPLTVHLRAAPPPPPVRPTAQEPQPQPPAAPAPRTRARAAPARPVIAVDPAVRQSADDTYAVAPAPAPAPAAADTPAGAAPRFDLDAARSTARKFANAPDPTKVGTALERLPPPPLQTESKFERAIKSAKRRDCKDGVPGGLLAPIFLAMDKKDSGCKW